MQTSINKAGQPVAVAGQLSDNGEVTDIVSRFNQETSAEIAFGLGVQQGAATHGVKLPSTILDHIVGINVFGFNHLRAGSVDGAGNPTGDLGATGLKPKAGMQILRKGRIYVVMDSTTVSVAPNVDRPHLRAISHTGVGTTVGAFAIAADGIDTIDLTKLGVFVGPLFTAADGVTLIAECEFDFTNKP